MDSGRRRTVFEVDADVAEEVVQCTCACKKVVDGKHTGHAIKFAIQPHFRFAQLLCCLEFSLKQQICKGQCCFQTISLVMSGALSACTYLAAFVWPPQNAFVPLQSLQATDPCP